MTVTVKNKLGGILITHNVSKQNIKLIKKAASIIKGTFECSIQYVIEDILEEFWEFCPLSPNGLVLEEIQQITINEDLL